MTRDLQAIAQESDWSQVYHLADTYRQQQQWQPAIMAFRRAIELRPDFFWSYHHLGDIWLRLQQWQQAVVAYSTAVKIEPNFFWSWHNLGDACSKLQQWQQAAYAYGQAIAIDPGFFWSWHNLGDVCGKLQQWDRGIAVYLQGIQLQPENPRIYQKLGTFFKQRGSLEDSIQDYRQLIRSPQGNSNSMLPNFPTEPQILVKIADNLVRYHQILGAIVLYYAILEVSPNQASVLLRLNQLLEKYNQLQQNIAKRQSQFSAASLVPKENHLIPQSVELQEMPGEIAIAENTAVSPEQLADLFTAVGWAERPLHKVKQCLATSFCYTTVWYLHNHQKQLIGFARAISDGAFHAVLLDVAINPQFQNRGWGKRLVQTIIKQLQQSDIRDISLFTSSHVMDFYHRLGFVSQPNNLQLMVWSSRN